MRDNKKHNIGYLDLILLPPALRLVLLSTIQKQNISILPPFCVLQKKKATTKKRQNFKRPSIPIYYIISIYILLGCHKVVSVGSPLVNHIFIIMIDFAY